VSPPGLLVFYNHRIAGKGRDADEEFPAAFTEIRNGDLPCPETQGRGPKFLTSTTCFEDQIAGTPYVGWFNLRVATNPSRPLRGEAAPLGGR
jgi:hypothetical protein